MQDVKIYGAIGCSKCVMAKSILERSKVPFDYIDLTNDQDLITQFKSQGMSELPIVSINGNLGGFNDLILKLKEVK